MGEYRVAGIPIRLSYPPSGFLDGRIDAYRLPDGSPVDYEIEAEIVSNIILPSTGPSIVFGRNRLYETAEGTELYVLSEDGTYVKQAQLVARDYRASRILLDERYGDRMSEIVYLSTGQCFLDVALKEGLLPLHAAAVACKGEAILFSAPSRTGKSTHANLWKTYAEDVAILNDDKPLISLRDGRLVVHGTPWAGKNAEHENASYPLRAIVFLAQDEVVRTVEMSEAEKLRELYRNSYRPRDGRLVENAATTIAAILKEADLFELRADMTKHTFDIVYERIYGGASK
ncbi:MAG: hypothetical protein WC509_00195 [Candidatus Izemoplasmatales bacterium]